MFIVGADIGQARDPTALAVVGADADEIQVRHLERLQLGTPYPQVVSRIVAVVLTVPGAELVVDATGVGRPIVDQLRAADLDPVAVTITAGKEATFKDGFWHVPKPELVRALVAAFEDDRFKIASSLRYAVALVGELQTFRRAVSPAPAGPPTARRRARMMIWSWPSRWRCGGAARPRARTHPLE